MKSKWAQIGSLWLFGVLAAAQLAKMAVLAPGLRRTFDLSLAQVGLLISLLEVGGALLGFAVGLLIGRIGARRFLLTGLLVLMLSGAAEAVATDIQLLFVARGVEGIGYVLVVVAAPTVIATIAAERERGAALALWSTFVPLGVALGSGVTGVAVVWLGSAETLLLWAASFAVALAMAAQLPALSRSAALRIALPPKAAWLSTLAFGLYTTLVCALTALLPIYFVERLGAGLSAASLVAALVSAAALPGCVAMIFVLRRGLPEPRRALLVVTPALLASTGPALMIFSNVIAFPKSISISGAFAVGTVLLGGLAPPLILARLPALSGAQSGDDPKLAVAQGLLTQFGAGGALIGPPLGGLVVGAWGWNALGSTIAGLTLAMLAILISAEWVANRRVPTVSRSRPPAPDAF
jgi:MFS transporter, CP family, cyanate transporter